MFLLVTYFLIIVQKFLLNNALSSVTCRKLIILKFKLFYLWEKSSEICRGRVNRINKTKELTEAEVELTLIAVTHDFINFSLNDYM